MKRQFHLHAAVGRVLLRFPPAVEQRNGVDIPIHSQQRLELAEVYDVGEAVTADDATCRAWLLERKANNQLVLASFAAGVDYWRQNYDIKQWGWLRDIRAFTLQQPSSWLEIIEGEESPVLYVPDASIAVQ